MCDKKNNMAINTVCIGIQRDPCELAITSPLFVDPDVIGIDVAVRLAGPLQNDACIIEWENVLVAVS